MKPLVPTAIAFPTSSPVSLLPPRKVEYRIAHVHKGEIVRRDPAGPRRVIGGKTVAGDIRVAEPVHGNPSSDVIVVATEIGGIDQRSVAGSGRVKLGDKHVERIADIIGD